MNEVLIIYYENIFNPLINGYEVFEYNTDTLLFTGSYDECMGYVKDNSLIIREEV